MTTEEKKKISELHAKYYGNKKKPKESKVAAKAPKEAKASRNQLMLQAKAKNIKNFRVISKAGLVEILKEGTSKERIGEIVAQAVARWKSTWGKGKRKQKIQK